MIDEKRIGEIQDRTLGKLSEKSMWNFWEVLVRANIGDGDFQVAKNHLYVAQPSPNDADYESLAKLVKSIPLHRFVRQHQCLDMKYGALGIPTSLGLVNRMWLDAVIEADFIRRHCGNFDSVLEIGSGYGRLALLLPLMLPIDNYYCVDAVPISTYLCEWYIAQNNGMAQTLTISELPDVKANLVINIHSWSECSRDQVSGWLEVVDACGAEWLFTKPHDENFSCWGGGEFRSLIEKKFEPVAVDRLCFNNVLHVMFKRKGR